MQKGTRGRRRAQVLVRGIALGVVERLRTRAEHSGRSLEAELRLILTDAVSENDVQEQVARVRALFAGQTFSDSVELLREDRER